MSKKITIKVTKGNAVRNCTYDGTDRSTRRAAYEALRLALIEAQKAGGEIAHVPGLGEFSIEAAISLLFPKSEVGYGATPDGRRAMAGGQRPMMAETSIEEVGQLSIVHYELPKFPDAEAEGVRDWLSSWHESNLVDLPGVTHAQAEGTKLTVRHDAGGEWLSVWERFGLRLKAEGKVLKRANIAYRLMRYTSHLPAGGWQPKIGIVHVEPGHDADWDGIVAVDRKEFLRILDQAEKEYGALVDAGLEVGPQGRGLIEKHGSWEKVPEKERKAAVAERKRTFESTRKKAEKLRLGNFRAIFPGLTDALIAYHDTLVGMGDDAHIGTIMKVHRMVHEGWAYTKGNYIVVDDLLDDAGNPVDYLFSLENVKGEIVTLDGGETPTMVGLEPQSVKGCRTSTQKLINLRSVYPTDQVFEWMKNEGIGIVEMLTTGKIEESARVAADTENDEFDTAVVGDDGESSSKRFRRAMESLLGVPGMHANNAPCLTMEAGLALLNRVGYRKKAKLNVPVPHSWAMQILPLCVATRLGFTVAVKDGEIDIDPERGFAVITDRDWDRARNNWGGSDHDDKYNLMYVRDWDGVVKVVVVRDPNDRGEWEVFVPTKGKKGEVKGLPKSESVTMGASHHSAILRFTRTEREIRQVDLRGLPTQMSVREAAGELTFDRPAGLGKKKAYPKGYTPEEVGFAMAHGMRGDGPGLVINAFMLRSLQGIDQETLPCRMEEVVDTFTQGGHKDAQAALTAWCEGQLELAVSDAIFGKKIDRLFWAKKRFQVPKSLRKKPTEYRMAMEGEHLCDDIITQLFGMLRQVRTSVVLRLRRWLAAWQMPIPAVGRFRRGGAVCKDRDGHEHPINSTVAGIAWAEWKKEGGPGEAFVALTTEEDAEKRPQLRAKYEQLVKRYVAEHSIYALLCNLEHLQDRRSWKRGLMSDHLVWNGTVGDLVIDFLHGRRDAWGCRLKVRDAAAANALRPLVVTDLTFRLANQTAGQVADALLERKETMTEAQWEGVLKWLTDFVGGGTMIKQMLGNPTVWASDFHSLVSAGQVAGKVGKLSPTMHVIPDAFFSDTALPEGERYVLRFSEDDEYIERFVVTAYEYTPAEAGSCFRWDVINNRETRQKAREVLEALGHNPPPTEGGGETADLPPTPKPTPASPKMVVVTSRDYHDVPLEVEEGKENDDAALCAAFNKKVDEWGEYYRAFVRKYVAEHRVELVRDVFERHDARRGIQFLIECVGEWVANETGDLVEWWFGKSGQTEYDYCEGDVLHVLEAEWAAMYREWESTPEEKVPSWEEQVDKVFYPRKGVTTDPLSVAEVKELLPNLEWGIKVGLISKDDVDGAMEIDAGDCLTRRGDDDTPMKAWLRYVVEALGAIHDDLTTVRVLGRRAQAEKMTREQVVAAWPHHRSFRNDEFGDESEKKLAIVLKLLKL